MDVALSLRTFTCRGREAAAHREPRGRRAAVTSGQSCGASGVRGAGPVSGYRTRPARCQLINAWPRSTSRLRSPISPSRTGTRRSTWTSAPHFCARTRPRHTCARQGGGRIINFSDWLARSGRPRYPAYLSYLRGQGGAIALTEALALELAADHILVRQHRAGSDPRTARDVKRGRQRSGRSSATPLGRWGGEIEIAKASCALLDSDFITGETIRVDGSRHSEIGGAIECAGARALQPSGRQGWSSNSCVIDPSALRVPRRSPRAKQKRT